MIIVDVKEVKFRVKQTRYVEVILDSRDVNFPTDVLGLGHFIDGIKDSPIDALEAAGYSGEWVDESVTVENLDVS